MLFRHIAYHSIARPYLFHHRSMLFPPAIRHFSSPILFPFLHLSISTYKFPLYVDTSPVSIVLICCHLLPFFAFCRLQIWVNMERETLSPKNIFVAYPARLLRLYSLSGYPLPMIAPGCRTCRKAVNITIILPSTLTPSHFGKAENP